MTARHIHLVHLVHLVLLAAYFVGVLLAWPRLPERIPTHFDLSGTPDVWSAKSPVAWFGPFAAALAVALMIIAAAWFARNSPHLWNIPEKKRFVALPRHLRAPIEARLERFLAATGVFSTLLFIGIQTGMYQTALREIHGLPWYSLAISVAGVVAIVGFGLRESAIAAREIRRLSS